MWGGGGGESYSLVQMQTNDEISLKKGKRGRT